MIGIFGAFEAASRFASWSEQLVDGVAVLLCTGVGVWALRRYLGLLATAEAAAHQAECSQCATYGRLELIQSDATGSEVQVRCRKCGHGWHISG